ncbi:hypothetical protein pdul_cds_902 [Pandoravirus dulcis]|uniref:Uncharacterized protein n=1 Tax=Pandoravirus dulcis TaxID=1349409 RepID=A0A291AU69_9VIRU|nr:hypothetical protein pdul_cds_902 [Pandoravirus dulcis]ATE82563.1 hypothetical protein pdul_cds_902 [Pandoravirus dulcis]
MTFCFSFADTSRRKYFFLKGREKTSGGTRSQRANHQRPRCRLFSPVCDQMPHRQKATFYPRLLCRQEINKDILAAHIIKPSNF